MGVAQVDKWRNSNSGLSKSSAKALRQECALCVHGEARRTWGWAGMKSESQQVSRCRSWRSPEMVERL